MGQSKMRAEKILVSVVENVVGANVNSACLWFLHQPKLPSKCLKLKKF